MWLVEFLPGWIWHLAIVAGVIGIVVSFVLKTIPFISQYRSAVQAASVASIVIGTFFTGASFNNDKWEARVKEAEQKALQAQVKSGQENVKIVTKTVEKIKVVQDVQVVVQKEIVRDTAIIDAECKVPVEFVTIHNKSATAREVKK
jgi:hypothetical protein